MNVPRTCLSQEHQKMYIFGCSLFCIYKKKPKVSFQLLWQIFFYAQKKFLEIMQFIFIQLINLFCILKPDYLLQFLLILFTSD